MWEIQPEETAFYISELRYALNMHKLLCDVVMPMLL